MFINDVNARECHAAELRNSFVVKSLKEKSTLITECKFQPL